jgi:hypothetical protein
MKTIVEYLRMLAFLIALGLLLANGMSLAGR